MMAEPTSAQFPAKAAALFLPAPYKVMHGGRGGAKCLAIGTRVIMADGSLRPIEDVGVGELLMGPDSRPRMVLAVTRGNGPLYRVSQTSAMDYVVNDAHILSLKKSKSCALDRGERSKAGNWRRPQGRYADWPEITNINVKQALEQSRRWCSHFRGWRAGVLNLSHRQLRIDPYFLGLWLGDGTGREMRITTADSEVVEWCGEYASRVGLRLTLNGKPGNKARDLGFVDTPGKRNRLWSCFKSYDLPNNKHIPTDFLLNSESNRLQLLAGIIDTDGTRHHGGYVIAQVNERLARDIKQLADGLGFRTSLKRRKTKCSNNGQLGEAWYVSLTGAAWRVPCRIARKKWKRSEIKPNKDHLLSEITITPVGYGKYAGVTLDGDQLFLLEDGTVTHNSWAAARALLILASQRKLFILCAREIQRSIRDSVHKLLVDQIDVLGLAHAFDINANAIVCTETGSRFVFAGVRNNVTAIKSMEAIDICCLDEAENVSGHSWSVLLPTVRRDPPHGPFKRGSEVWVIFNPELDSDYTYKFWLLDPPKPVFRFDDSHGVDAAKAAMLAAKPTTVLIEMNWRDNEWFPDILRKQKEDLRRRDYESYLTVWEGKVRRIVQGAIYARELDKAQRENRISGTVEIDRSKPIDIGVDLGRADMTSLWFAQQVGMQHHFVDFYENFGFDWEHYLEQIQERKYVIGRIYLPHDARNKHVDAKKSVFQQTRDAYPRDGQVIVVPVTKAVVNDINAVRQMFPRMWFNEKRCSNGLHSLAHYRYEVDSETREVAEKPLHDWASHGADALRTYVMGLRDHPVNNRAQMHMPAPPPRSEQRGTGWLSI